MSQLFLLPETWISLLTLTLLEVVLGVDNLVFIAVITGRVAVEKQKIARRLGLLLACIMRLLLLAFILWLTNFSKPLLTIFSQTFSLRDGVLLVGGLFLIAKATNEIHVSVLTTEKKSEKLPAANFILVIIQIMLLDIVFSLDSVFTAVGLAKDFVIMAIAIITAVLMMLIASEPLSRIIYTYPSIKTLALSFLLLVGVMLIADGFGFHVPRGYLYFAIAFSLFVEIVNIVSGRRTPSSKK